MEKKTWKIIALVFIILFITENLLLGYNLYSLNKIDKEIKICYYDICEEYPDADLSEGVCYCYDYDMLGELVLAKTKIIN